MEFFDLLLKTVVLRPYVFVFLAVFLFLAKGLIGWRRTGYFMGITFIVAFLCEFSSTHTGIPFGWYHYTGSTVGQELYMWNVPFMDSLSFPFLLYASYCMALAFLLPAESVKNPSSGINLIQMAFSVTARTSWPVVLLTMLFFTYLDIVIDPVALRGERWFLGRIYYYPDPGTHFGVPIANYIGWAVVAFLSLRAYLPIDRKFQTTLSPPPLVTRHVLLGCGLYYGVLIFNLAITFWIGESLLGTTGLIIYLPITVLLGLRLLGRLPAISNAGI